MTDTANPHDPCTDDAARRSRGWPGGGRAVLLALVLAAAALVGCGSDVSFKAPPYTPPDPSECNVYAWEPGRGDISSWPSMELLAPDPSTKTGYRVAASRDAFPDAMQQYGSFASVLYDDMAKLDGFATNGGAFLGFTGELDPGQLGRYQGVPRPRAGAGIVVMPEHAPPYLAEVSLTTTADRKTLIVQQMRPLPSGTRVAVYVTKSLALATGGCIAPSKGMHDLLYVDPDTMAAVHALETLGIVRSAESMVAVQPYVTQSATEDGVAVAAYVASRDPSELALRDIECDPPGDTYRHCTAKLTSGDFLNDAGEIDVDPSDVQPHATWDLIVHSFLPVGAGPGPYPTVLFGHGLGGSALSHGSQFASKLAPAGFATVAVSAMQHGDHPSNAGHEGEGGVESTLRFFGIDVAGPTVHVLKLRANFEQSVYDRLYVTRALEQGPDLDGDGVPDVDPSKLAYAGVSLGGIMGSEQLALSDAFTAGVLIVPGGRLLSLVQEPDNSFYPLIHTLFSSRSQSEIDRMFVVAQAALDGGDAATWGAHIVRDRLVPGARTPSVLAGIALDDDTVANVSNYALMRAIDLPAVGLYLRPQPGLAAAPPAPIAGNLGRGVTGGFIQFDLEGDGMGGTRHVDHGSTAGSDVGLAAWTEFLTTAFEGQPPTIIDPYVTLQVPHSGAP